jgi:hypothetical protein
VFLDRQIEHDVQREGLVVRNLPCSQNLDIRSAREPRVVAHCILFKTTDARIPDTRGTR